MRCERYNHAECTQRVQFGLNVTREFVKRSWIHSNGNHCAYLFILNLFFLSYKLNNFFLLLFLFLPQNLFIVKLSLSTNFFLHPKCSKEKLLKITTQKRKKLYKDNKKVANNGKKCFKKIKKFLRKHSTKKIKKIH